MYLILDVQVNCMFVFSATGDLKILEVHPDGKYIRLINTNPNKVSYR